MASASRRALPRFDASRRRGGENGDETTVDVFHPTVDPFCPSRQVPYLRERGAEVHVVRDSHVLVGMHTWEQIKRSFEKLLEIPIDASA
uniref:Uncharacterized protein n=2 Tax=Odontella aurita TaxID=265563 RepID=A0A7S4JBI5_9STRA